MLLEVSNEFLAKLFLPLAFIVSVTEAAVEMEDATITSGSHVKVNSQSTVGIKTTANTGMLPVALSVAVAVNDSHITVGGKTSITAQGDVELISKAVTSAEAKAARGQTAGGNISAYIAIEAAVQEGGAKITDQASVNAGGAYESSFEQRDIKRAALLNSRNKILLADESKFNDNSLYRTCGLADFDAIYTDAPEDLVSPLKALPGVTVISSAQD